MPAARVTIGIPCYNCAQYLPALLRSIECQSFASWEAIAVDDASTDGTAEILRSLRHPRIRVVFSKENLGLGARLNEINELSQTEFIARTDADDLMHPERLARQIACFDEDPSLEVCATGTYTIDNCNRLLGIRRVPPLARTPDEVLQRNGPSHPTVTARRGWFLKFPYRPHPKRGEDLDLWVRAVSDSRMQQLDAPLHFIREDPAFDLAKYRRSMRDHRILFRRHRNSAGHALSHWSLLLQSYGKETVYATLTAAGLAGKLAARRNVPLGKLAAREVDAILARILDPIHEKADEEVEVSMIPEVLTQEA
ncbi:MAG: glycosyltransferase family 2 protein [Bryobacterales bacterium]|nr:glycosyltransferase family 2 protein [Bryobacterales bacterium]